MMGSKFSLLTSVGVSPATGRELHQVEQSDFSAEDAAVRKPVAIPQRVLTNLEKDETVQNVLRDQNIQPGDLPASWFSASAIHLSGSKATDLIVVGEPPLVGGNVTLFWVFRATPRGP